MAQVTKFEIKDFIAGETKTFTFLLKDENGVPLDLTLFTSVLKACREGDKENSLLEKECTPDTEQVGVLSVTLVPTDTIDWDGYYTFQVIVTQSSLNEYKVEGTWHVIGAIQ